MRTARLAQLLEQKYSLETRAAVTIVSPAILEAVKKEIRNAYNLYVNQNTAKEPVIQMAANAGMPYLKELAAEMQKLIEGLDGLSATKIFNRINKIAKEVEYISSFHSGTRSAIHDTTRATREPEKNYRELIKSKLGRVLSPLSSLLVNAVRVLGKALEKDPKEFANKIGEPAPKALSRDAIAMFIKMHPEVSQKYGLSSMDVWAEALRLNRRLLEQFIGAIKRNQIPTVGHEVVKLTNAIKERLVLKQTNVEQFEQEAPRNPSEMFQYEDEEPEHRIEGDPERAAPSVLDPMELVRKQEQMKKEDEEKALRQKQFEESEVSKLGSRLLSKYNGAYLYQLPRKV